MELKIFLKTSDSIMNINITADKEKVRKIWQKKEINMQMSMGTKIAAAWWYLP